MNNDRQRIDPTTAEHLIRNARTGSPAGDDPLADLLAATTVPARPGELRGEDAATMAFRNARRTDDPKPTSRSTSKSAFAKLTTAKAAIVLAAAGGGGIALAAETGNLPGTNPPDNYTTARHSQTAPATAPGPTSSATGTSTTTAEQDGATPTGSTPPDAAPRTSLSPSLRQLCLTFQASTGDGDDQGLDDRSFTVLTTAAGGEDNVGRYCTTLLATPATTTAPTQDDNDNQSGSTTHPTDQQTAPPSHGDSTHPSDPTQAPTPPSHPAPPSHRTPTPGHTH